MLILGAGLAGLSAAARLREMGLSVQILEARGRVGGRMHTDRELPDQPEYGGVQVGAGYARIRAAGITNGVAFGPSPGWEAYGRNPFANGWALSVNGHLSSTDNWPTSPGNVLPDEERANLPTSMFHRALGPLNPLKELGDWSDSQYLSDDESLKTVLSRAGYSDEAQRLMNISADNNGLDSASALRTWRNHLLFRSAGPSQFVQGGSSALPVAMAQPLASTLDLNTAIIQLSEDNAGVRALTEDGRSFRADHCICTLPLPALGRVKLDLHLDRDQTEAIKQVPYSRVTLIMVDINDAGTETFWDDDGLPIMMWTDSPLERWFPRVDSNGNLVGYKLWINGQGSSRIDAMDEATVRTFVETTMARIRPSLQRKVRYVKRFSWAQQAFSGGAYAFWPVGATARLANATRRPSQRVFFAGEHTALHRTGMEGAMESADRAVAQLASYTVS